MSVSITSQTFACTMTTYLVTSIIGMSVSLKTSLCNPYPAGDYSLTDTHDEGLDNRTFRGLCILGSSIVAPLVLTTAAVCIMKLAANRFNQPPSQSLLSA